MEKSFGRRRAAFDGHILCRAAAQPFAHPLQQHRPSRAAAAEDDGDGGWRRFESALDASIERRLLTRHVRNSLCRHLMRSRTNRWFTGVYADRGIGIRMPREAAVAIASGYPASACRATPMPGSQVSTRSSLASASTEPSATITIPAWSEYPMPTPPP